MKRSLSFRAALLVVNFFLCCAMNGQQMGHREVFIGWDDFVEEFLQFAEESEADGIPPLRGTSSWLEALEERRQHPLNLNTARREDFLEFNWLTQAQVDSLLAYRDRIRAFASLGELVLVRELSYNDRRWLSLFVFAGDTLKSSEAWHETWRSGQHEVEARVDVPLYKRRGFIVNNIDEIKKNRNRIYLGDRFAHTLRYRYRWRNRLQWGLRFQNDVGEPFARHRNYPYDFASFHLVAGGETSRRQMIFGDFTAHFGQGLLLGNRFMKSPELLLQQPAAETSRLRPHTTTDEHRFLRGIAVRQQWHRWTLLNFASYRKWDARIENDTVRSFRTDGLHRSLRELSERNRVGVFTLGTHLEWQRRGMIIGASAFFLHLSLPVMPTFHRYNRHDLQGKHAGGMSINYRWNRRKWNVQGECALDMNAHLSTTHTIFYETSSSLSLIGQWRWFSSQFVAPLGRVLQQGSRCRNEVALAGGWRWQLARRVEMSGFIDFHRFPQPSFRADSAANGAALRMEMQYRVSGNTTHRLRYSLKSKQQNISGHAPWLEYRTTHRLLWQSRYRFSKGQWQWGVEGALFHSQTRKTPSLGVLLSARANLELTSACQLSLFAALFTTEDYDTRLYAYQPRLRGMGGFPLFYQKGTSTVVQLKWRLRDGWTFGGRWSFLHYFNRSEIGSGMQRIGSPSQNDLSVQLRWQF